MQCKQFREQPKMQNKPPKKQVKILRMLQKKPNRSSRTKPIKLQIRLSKLKTILRMERKMPKDKQKKQQTK